MIEGLKPYAEYKESDIPWALALPSSWQTERAKRLFTKMQRPMRPEDEVVTCFRDGMVTLRKNRRLRGFTEATVESGYQGIRKGDLVIHGMDAFAGAIGVSDSDGKGTPVYNVCQPGPGVVASYYAHTVREMSRAQWILALAKGIRERSTDFRYEMFGNQFVPLPPPDEQAAIVRFLDHANRKIDGFIRAKRKLIGLLNEQKQAIIHRAVTRGLHPDVPLKPSGIPWLGDIPKHWEVRRLRQIAAVNPSKSESSDAIHRNTLVTFLPMERVGTNGAIDASERLPARDISTGFTYFRRGDVIVAKITPCFENGKGAFLDRLPTDFGFGSTEFHVLRPSRNLLGGFLRLVTSSRMFLTNGANNMIGSAGQQRVPTDFVRNYPIVLPPTIEQQAILDGVAEETVPLTTAIARTEREIALMQEYRTRLTADIVTGKLDVREAAAKLPGLPTDSAAEPLADEALDDTETEDAEA